MHPKNDPTAEERRRASVSPREVFDEIDALRDHSRRSTEKTELEDLRRGYSMIETLLSVSTSFSSTLDLEKLLGKIVDAVVRITDTDNGYLMLAENDELSLALARSRTGEELGAEDFDVSMSVIQRAASTGKPQIITNAQEDEYLKKQRSIIDLKIETAVCVPLVFEDRLVGVIYADSDRVSESFSPSDISILNAFGTQAAVAIDNARRHGELVGIRSSLERQNQSLRRELAGRYEFSGIVGRSKSMQRIFEVIRKVAPLDTTVLIQGETGTGKELIARAIHYNGRRKDRSIVSINCGALPKDILESELFGYRKGAFTGADQDRSGLFEAADGGTLFLDEIGEMPVELQVKLLRALQEGEIRRLGEDRSRPVDVRVIAATNRNLATEVGKGTFRNDLFYRLNVVPVVLPPLRDRPEDILPLAELFLDRFAKEMNKPKPVMTREAKELLLTHSWYGNVRELENAIERALALGEGDRTIDLAQFDHLADAHSVANASPDQSLKDLLFAMEKEIVRKALVKNSWNISRAAGTLQISRQQLHNKIRKFALHSEI